MKLRAVVVACVAALGLADCAGPKAPLSPPRLINSQDTDMSIQLFMQATILLGRYYGFENLDYEAVREKSAQAGFNTLPFMPPQIVTATPPFKTRTLKAWIPKTEGDRFDTRVVAYQSWVNKNMGYNNLVKYYISTGLRASQIVCRNFLQGLDERNRYLDFLRAEFGVFNTLADGVLAAVDANGTLRNAFALGRNFTNDALNAYDDYRFLKVDYEQARLLVETAQNQLAQYQYTLVDGSQPAVTESGRTIYKAMYTFPDALNAVSIIEGQCTRAGIQRLLTKATYAAPSNLGIDPVTGEVIFRSNADAGNDAQSPAVVNANANRNATNNLGKKGNTPPLAGIAAAPAPSAAAATDTEPSQP